MKQPFRIKLPNQPLQFSASLFIIVPLIFIIGAVVWLITSYESVSLETVLITLMFILFLRFGPMTRWFGSPFRSLKTPLRSIAALNNLSFYEKAHPHYDNLFYPAIASLGLRPRREFTAVGEISGLPIELYLQTHRSYFRRDTDRVEVFIIKLRFDKLLPHTFIQSRNQRRSLFITSIERSFDDNQRVSLPHNLDEFFLLYTHRRTVTDALTVWSPQLLEELRNQNALLSVETIGHDAYLYLAPGYRSFDLKQVIAFTEVLTNSLQRTTRTHFLKLPNDKKYPFLRSRPAGGIIKLAGKYWNFGVTFVIAFLAYRLLRWGLDVESSVQLALLIIQVIVSLVLITFFTSARSAFTRTKDKRGY